MRPVNKYLAVRAAAFKLLKVDIVAIKAILEPGQRWKTDADVRVMRFDRIATAEHRAAATAVEALRGLAKA